MQFFLMQPVNLFRMGLFGAAHGWLEKVYLPKICHIYPTMMKLGSVIPYLKNIQKLINHVAHPLSSVHINIFTAVFSNVCYNKNCRYILQFHA